ncbi:MAG: DNA primase [Verrucomicrobia bacterium]|nr:DNA primase [Verrucomicrobiota bacterium]
MPGLFSQAVLEQIRAASDIVEVINSVLPLKRAGANFVALCPFHKEKTPSFNVNPHKQIFHCFGCHKGGDVFTFIQEYENISFGEAVRRLAERAKIALEFEKEPGGQQSRFLKESLLEIHERMAQRWHTNLLNDAAGEPARAYLAKRGVSDEAVKLFRLGYAPDAWDDTVNWAKSKGYAWPLIEQAGLIIRKEGEERYYDRFRGRLMFPICDEQGRVIGFSGRVIAGDEKTAKYVNSPETPIFTKGKVFFGLDKSKRALLDAQCAIICEGQLDLIACYMAGVRNVVAPQGTAFTADHARILKRYVDEVVLCFDSDTAGQAAAIRVLDSLLASGLAVRVASIPAPHDPDSLIKEQGGPAFQQLIDRAEGFFDFYLNHLCRTHDVRSDKGQMAIAKAMAEAVQKTGHQVLVDKYAQQTALRLGVAPEAVRLEFGRLARIGAKRREPVEAGTETPEAAARPAPQEVWLLKLILLHEDVLPWVTVHFDLKWIENHQVRAIVAARMALHSQQSATGAPALLAQFEDSSARSMISEALAESRAIPNPLQQIQDLGLRLRNLSIDRALRDLIRRCGLPETSEGERLQLLQEQMELRRVKQQPLAPRP